MAKFCFFIISLTLVTVAYGSLQGARKFVVPVREILPEGYPDCVPDTCTVATEDVDCPEPGCICDDDTHICREKECSDLACRQETVEEDCPSFCGCDENLWSCYELPPPPEDDTDHTGDSDGSNYSNDSDDSDGKYYRDGGYGNSYSNDIDFNDGSDGSDYGSDGNYYGEKK